jgi:tripartite-type tricarboxylate transporter receptor subunit TctC
MGIFMTVSKTCKAMMPVLMFACATLAGPAKAANYPDKPVHLVVGYVPGGALDITARIIAPALGQALGQAVIVENRPGANSITGSEHVAHSAPDGYTVLLNGAPMAINASLYPSLPYDTIKDFSPIGLATTGTFLFVIDPRLPVKSVAEFIALAKAKPGTLNFCSSGQGSPAHLNGELFKETTHIDIVHVPYKGPVPCITDILSGHDQATFEAMPALLANVRAGNLRALAVMSAKRSPILPDLPTIAEASGYPDLSAIGWYGLFGPANLPPNVIATLNAALNQALADPDTKKKLAAQGLDATPSTSPEFKTLVTSEVSKWAKVVKTSGAKVE